MDTFENERREKRREKRHQTYLKGIQSETSKQREDRNRDRRQRYQKRIQTETTNEYEAVNEDKRKRSRNGQSRVYRSVDSICKSTANYESMETMYPPENLNTIRLSDIENMEAHMLLKDLTTGHANGYIKVRVIREWEGKKPDSSHVVSKNYILLDEEGTQIQAAPLQNSLIKLFSKKLVLGKVHKISNYNVVHAKDYRPVPAEHLINFHRTTQVETIDDIPTIPRYKFELTKFEDARKRVDETKNLMDIGGKLIMTTGLQATKKGKKKVDILLANKRDDKIKITLWENQAHAFLELEHQYRKPNVFVIVTSTSAKNIQEECVLWSSFSTQYYFNIEHPDLVELRENCKLDENQIPTIVQSLDTKKQTNADPIEKIKIEQLFKAKLPAGASTIKFITEATVVGVDPTKLWYYTGCSKCTTKFKDSLLCTKCKQITTSVPLFRIVAEVTDSTSSTTFVMFERDVQKLINVSAQHILTNDKNASPYVIPAVLNNILGKTCVFNLTLDKKNIEFKYEDYPVSDVQEISLQGPNEATSAIVTVGSSTSNTGNIDNNPPKLPHYTSTDGNQDQHNIKRQKTIH